MFKPSMLWGVAAMIAMALNAHAIEVGKRGLYLKTYGTIFRSNSQFDNFWHREQFGYGGQGKFYSVVADYRYGITNRLNAGINLAWNSNRFKNDFDVLLHERLADLTLLAEYRLLDFPDDPRVLAIRAGTNIPTGYSKTNPLWIGDGAVEAFFGVGYKRFKKGRYFDPFWFEVDAAVRFPLEHSGKNIDGDWSIPTRTSINIRPSYKWIFSGGINASFNDNRAYIVGEGGIKFRLNDPTELEFGANYIFAGRNSSPGFTLLAGVLINTGRIWNERKIRSK
jgi:hypothetical protein